MTDCRTVMDAIAEVFPHPVVVECERVRDMTDYLYPEERELVADSSSLARQQFSVGRFCARSAMRKLGIAGAPLLRGARGDPLWPPGMVGSIAHKRCRCLVVAGSSLVFKSIGIDLERQGHLCQEVWHQFMTSSEIVSLSEMRNNAERMANMLFSAKEAALKCLQPLTDKELRLVDLRVSMDWQRRRFQGNSPDWPGPVEGVILPATPWIIAVSHLTINPAST